MEKKTDSVRTILSRGVEEVIILKILEKRLESGKKLRVKLGIDPTAPDIHLGHSVVLRKLRQFQDAGHKAVLIIGDFTAQIGDPSGRNKERPPLTEKEVKENMRGYLAEAGKILDIKKAEIRKNSEWHKKMGFRELAGLLSDFSAQQILEREDFSARMKERKPLWMHELLYPALQAYDSVVVKADVELGGTDQKFNLLAGRQLMEKRGLLPQDVLMTPLIEGTDGSKKMSKSAGNYISLSASPADMFGKIMSVPDSLIPKYFELLTDRDMTEPDPYRAKLILAETLTEMYHGTKNAEKAKEHFVGAFSKRIVPDDIPSFSLSQKKMKLSDFLVRAGISSKSEARRLILQNAIQINQETVFLDDEIVFAPGDVVKIGKKKFLRIK